MLYVLSRFATFFLISFVARIRKRTSYLGLGPVSLFVFHHLPRVLCGQYIVLSASAGHWNSTSYDSGVFSCTPYPPATE